jgi:hypothetical protein
MNIVEYFEKQRREIQEQLEALESGRVIRAKIASSEPGLLACGGESAAHQFQPKIACMSSQPRP